MSEEDFGLPGPPEPTHCANCGVWLGSGHDDVLCRILRPRTPPRGPAPPARPTKVVRDGTVLTEDRRVLTYPQNRWPEEMRLRYGQAYAGPLEEGRG